MSKNMEDILFLCPMCENEDIDGADGGFPCYCVEVSETPGFVSYRVIVYEALNVWDFSTTQVVAELKRRAQVPLTDEMATEMIKAQQRHEKQTYEDWLAFASRPRKPVRDEDIPF